MCHHAPLGFCFFNCLTVWPSIHDIAQTDLQFATILPYPPKQREYYHMLQAAGWL